MLDLQTICLGVLYSGSKSGYELHKAINTDLKHFQTASFGALYPALGKLEAKKFIASDGKKNPTQTSSLPKKVYTITENGRAVFEIRIQKTRAEEKLTSDFLAAFHFAEHLPAENIAALIDAQSAKLQDEYRALVSAPLSRMPEGQRFGIRYTIAINRAATAFLKGEGRAIQTTLGRRPSKD